MGAQRRRRHPGARRGARDLLQSTTRLKQLSGLERTDLRLLQESTRQSCLKIDWFSGDGVVEFQKLRVQQISPIARKAG